MEVQERRVFKAELKPKLFADGLRELALQNITVLSIDECLVRYLMPPSNAGEKIEYHARALQRLFLIEDEIKVNLISCARKGEFLYTWSEFKEGTIHKGVNGGSKRGPKLTYEDQVLLQLIYQKFTGVKIIPVVRLNEPVEGQLRRYFIDLKMNW